MTYTLYHGDCLTEMDKIPDGSIDAIITDLPYGTTACSWDSVIPFEPMWAQFKRVVKPRAAVVLFGSEPFSSALRMSNLDWYKYDWVWDKRSPVDHLNVHRKPMGVHENISLFCDGWPVYNQQFRNDTKKKREIGVRIGNNKKNNTYGQSGNIRNFGIGYPMTIISFSRPTSSKFHPTQKPVALLEYLVKTYTNEGDTVLDCTFGSGTTGVACGRLNRPFVGIELYPLPGIPVDEKTNPNYFFDGQNRIMNAYGDYVRTPEEVAKGQLSFFDLGGE